MIRFFFFFLFLFSSAVYAVERLPSDYTDFIGETRPCSFFQSAEAGDCRLISINTYTYIYVPYLSAYTDEFLWYKFVQSDNPTTELSNQPEDSMDVACKSQDTTCRTRDDDAPGGYAPTLCPQYNPRNKCFPNSAASHKPALCGINSHSFLSKEIFIGSYIAFLHTQCEAEIVWLLGRYRDLCDPTESWELGDCNCPNFPANASSFRLELCHPTFDVAQKTAKTKNKLLSEFNSKLHFLTNATSAEVSFYDQILHLFSDIAAGFTSKDDLEDSDIFELSTIESTKTDGDKTTFSDITKGVSDLALSSSSYSSCPEPLPLSLSFATDTRANNGVKVKFDSLCTFARKIRNVVVLAAQVSSAYYLLVML